MGIRNLKQREIELISWMIKNKDKGPSIIKTLGSLLVEGMDDGGMGSLRVIKDGIDNRHYGGDLAQADFFDIDKVPVFISVVLDQEGKIFELEVFRGEKSPLKEGPKLRKY